MFSVVKKHNKCIIVTEESKGFGFAQGLAGEIQQECFEFLEAPVSVIGAEDLPAIPLNSILEKSMIPNAEKVGKLIKKMLNY